MCIRDSYLTERSILSVKMRSIIGHDKKLAASAVGMLGAGHGNDLSLIHIFMDTETYEQQPLNADKLGDSFRFVKENMLVKILSYKGVVFGIEPPNFVELEITETEPGFKGDTTTNVLKPATVETGAEVRVPLFIDIGDKIKIDTRTGEYLERAKS